MSGNDYTKKIYQSSWLKRYGWWVISIVIVLVGVIVAVTVNIVQEHKHDKQDYVSPTPIPSDNDLPVTLEHFTTI